MVRPTEKTDDEPRGVLDRVIALYRKPIVKLNTDVIAATAVGLGVASGVLARMPDADPVAATVVGSVVLTAVYVPMHAAFTYAGHRSRYTADGRLRGRRFAKDLLKIYAAKLPAIVAYSFLAPTVQYLLDDGGAGPVEALWIAQGGGTLVTRLIHTPAFVGLEALLRGTKVGE